MIRAVMTKDNGRKLLILGVDKENIRRLTECDEPLFLDGRTVQIDGIDLVILYGETIRDVIRTIKEKFHCELPDVPQVGIPYEFSARSRNKKKE
jgi:hypothetical protein